MTMVDDEDGYISFTSIERKRATCVLKLLDREGQLLGPDLDLVRKALTVVAERNSEAEMLCGQTYQLVGNVAHLISDPDKWLDNLCNQQMVHHDMSLVSLQTYTDEQGKVWEPATAEEHAKVCLELEQLKLCQA